jgi:hypothetical protein
MVSIAHQVAAALRCNASSNSHGVVRRGTGLNPTTPSQFSCKSMSSSIFGYSLSRINGSRLPFCQRQSILSTFATFSGEGPIMSKSSLSMIKDASITAEPPQDQKIKVRLGGTHLCGLTFPSFSLYIMKLYGFTLIKGIWENDNLDLKLRER